MVYHSWQHHHQQHQHHPVNVTQKEYFFTFEKIGMKREIRMNVSVRRQYVSYTSEV